MAKKASIILGINDDSTVTTSEGCREFHNLSKVDKIATLKFLNFKFVGKPPMHFSNYELEYAFRNIIAGTPKEIPVPTPTPKETPMPTTKPTVKSSGLDDIIGNIVTEALASYVPDTIIDESLIESRINDAFTAYSTKVESVISVLSERVDSLRPKVTEVTLPNREVRKLNGVQHNQFPQVLAHISMGNNIMLIGSAGTGKSTLAKKSAEALGLKFGAKSFSAQSTEASLLGYNNANGDYVPTVLRELFETGGVMCLDEIDNANPNILSVLNTMLGNDFMAFPDKMVPKHDNFIVVATANTYGNGATVEYVGRNAIDGATRDRFMMMNIMIDEDIEDAMVQAVGLIPTQAEAWLKAVRQCRHNVSQYGLKVIVSPRAAEGGAKMLKTGAFSNQQVIEQSILKGCTADIASKVLESVSF